MKEHLSPSQINTFLACEYKWYCRWVRGLIIPPSGALIRGSAYHKALEHNYKQKITTQKDLPLDEVCDVYSQEFENKKSEADFKGEDPEKLKDEGYAALTMYHKEMSPKIQPVAVEEEIAYQIGEDVVIKGVLDLKTDSHIIDNKTASRTPSKVEYGYMLQLHTYAVLNPDHKLRLDFSVMKKNPEIVALEVPKPTTNDIVHLQKMYLSISQRMFLLRDDIIPITPNRTGFLCSRVWCGYWAECEKNFGGTVREK